MTTRKPAIKGLYAVTPDEQDTARLLARVEAALEGGARMLQYRNKSASPALRATQASALRCLCQAAGVPLIVNDDLAIALAVGAEGVHLGRDDGDLPSARNRFPQGLIGVSCYNESVRAERALTGGADYVAFGSFFPSSTKPGAVAAPLTLIAEAKRIVGLPIVAIGGITLENAPRLLAAGADAIAVISALFDAPDVRQAARRFAALFEVDTV